LSKLLKKGSNGQQRGLAIRKAAVEFAAVQKPVSAPEQTPMHAVAHPYPP
jgi:hypothetical protein